MPDLPSVPKKRLALFLDGTWNVSDNTKVWRLRSLFAAIGADGSSNAPITAQAWAPNSVKGSEEACSVAARYCNHQCLRMAG
jgi:hypothetical protein